MVIGSQEPQDPAYRATLLFYIAAMLKKVVNERGGFVNFSQNILRILNFLGNIWGRWGQLMGLRQLYFLLEGLLTRLIYLSKGLSFILAFIGGKMILEALHGNGVEVPEISLELSLGVIVLTLVITAVTSLSATRNGGPREKSQLP